MSGAAQAVASTGQTRLNQATTVVALSMPAPGRDALARSGRAYVTIEGLEYDEAPGGMYNVFLRGAGDKREQIGIINFFNIAPSRPGAQTSHAGHQRTRGTFRFDITDAVKQLNLSGDAALSLIFEPTTGLTGSSPEAAAQELNPQANVRFQSARVLVTSMKPSVTFLTSAREGFSNIHHLMGLVPPEQIALSLGRPSCVRRVSRGLHHAPAKRRSHRFGSRSRFRRRPADRPFWRQQRSFGLGKRAHTFSYANAACSLIARATEGETDVETEAVCLRAALHGALAVYPDRYLNIPPARLPSEDDHVISTPAELRPHPRCLRPPAAGRASWAAGGSSFAASYPCRSHCAIGACAPARGRGFDFVQNLSRRRQ